MPDEHGCSRRVVVAGRGLTSETLTVPRPIGPPRATAWYTNTRRLHRGKVALTVKKICALLFIRCFAHKLDEPAVF